jgi:predicted TIM-barrel fold metal-dependent hydrolase
VEIQMIEAELVLGEFTNRELLGVAVGYGQKEEGLNLTSFDPAAIFSHSLEDMDKRAAFLDQEGIESQFIYPTLGLFWEDGVEDPDLAAAHCRAYNRWALEMCASHRDRFYPVGHVSLRSPVELRTRFGIPLTMAYGQSLSRRCRSVVRV